MEVSPHSGPLCKDNSLEALDRTSLPPCGLSVRQGDQFICGVNKDGLVFLTLNRRQKVACPPFLLECAIGLLTSIFLSRSAVEESRKSDRAETDEKEQIHFALKQLGP